MAESADNKNSSSNNLPPPFRGPQPGRSRKNSRVTRSQINDFQSHALNNSSSNNNLAERGGGEEEKEMVYGKEAGKRNRYHVCRHCKRSFSSGRALGGHIRIHGASFRAQNSSPEQPMLPSVADSSNNSSSSSRPNVVGSEERAAEETSSAEGELGKESNTKASKKLASLYTLRNNPKRSSIFMDPEFSLEDDAVVGSFGLNKKSNLTSATPHLLLCESGSESKSKCPVVGTWSVTRNRSERRQGRVPNDRDTANLLVMLAAKVNNGIESQGSIKDSQLQGDSEECHDFVNYSRGRKRPKFDDHHRCNTCNKVFSSHQALGGHRASHRKVKSSFLNDEDETENEEEDEEEEEAEASHNLLIRVSNNRVAEEEGDAADGDGGIANSHLSSQDQARSSESLCRKQSPPPHQCSICFKVFLSGQALGGHKRCHWIAEKGAVAGDALTATTTAHSVVSTVDKIVEGNRHGKHGPCHGGGGGGGDDLFDLNQAPPTDEDGFPGSDQLAPASAQSANHKFKVLQSLNNIVRRID